MKNKKRFKRDTVAVVLAAVGFISTLGINGCGASRQISHTVQQEHAPRQHVNSEAMRHVIDGALYELIGQPKTALVEYHQAAEIDSASDGIHVALAENYYVIGEFRTCIRQLEKALRLNPDNPLALELLAVAHEKLDNTFAAMQAYKELSRVEPYNLDALYNLLSLQVQNQMSEDALSTFNNLTSHGIEDPNDQMQIGHLFLQHQMIEQASRIYSDILADNPDIEEAYLGMAATAKAQQDTMSAESWYRRALDQNPRFVEAKEELLLLYRNQKAYDKALSLYHDLQNRIDLSFDDLLELSQLHVFQKDTLQATETVKTIIESYPDREQGYLALGALQKAKNDTASAIETYETALQHKQGFLTVRRELKNLYVRHKRWNRAIDLYSPLTTVDSTRVGALIEISNLMMQKGDTLSAIERVKGLMDDHENDWRVPATLARYHFMTKHNQQAASYFNKSIELRKDLPGLWVLRGINYIRMDSLQQALDNFLASLDQFPEDAEMNYYAGILYNRQSNYVRAATFLEKALEQDPKNIQALLALSNAYDELHQFSRSEDVYQTLLRIAGDRAVVLNNYAYHLAVQGIRLEEALEYSQKALNAEPDNAAYLDTIGWICFKRGELDKAETFILKAISSGEQSAEVYEHLGDVYMKMGKPDKARKAWKTALELDESLQHVATKIEKLSKPQSSAP
jgi:tetratricopeptide (TPR) repeat protein